MSSLRSRVATNVYRVVGRLPLDPPETWSPVFLVGCGRSGTTITCSMLGQHPEIVALNEPRHIWRAVDIRTDIWSQAGRENGAKLCFAENDASSALKQRCQRSFYARQRLARAKILVEKLPINNFRLAWLASIFPHGRFINILRDGRDVAASIQRQGDRWFGADNWKWSRLQELARDRGLPLEMIETDDTYQRGLLEWTLSVESAEQFFVQHPDVAVHRMNYEELLSSPAATLSKLLHFLDADSEDAVVRKLVGAVQCSSRQTPTSDLHPRVLETLLRFNYR